MASQPPSAGSPQSDPAHRLPTESAPRSQRLERLGRESFDVLVVGGGITGAGVARDAVMRGLSVALVERSDYASGTSSRSSKLVHGGLRYLERFQMGLVHESLRERHVQRKLNPHLVWPVPFVFPVYRSDRNGLFKINFGLYLYDALALFRSYRNHKRLGHAKTLETVPGLIGDGLSGSVFYYDCRTDDARLTLANALDAAAKGAVVLNYAELVAPRWDGERVAGATVRDRLTGDEIAVTARHIVYCGGPWTDALPAAPGDGQLLRRTKGVHIVVPRERLPLDVVITMSHAEEERVLFAIPFFDCVYIGTTDTDFEGDPGQVYADADDVAYLLETTNRYFPEANLTAADVRSTWAGVRPLIRPDRDVSASATSREHHLYTDPRGVTTIAGGKLTTYRAMAEEVVDDVVGDLKKHGGAEVSRCTTARVPLDPHLPEADPIEGFPDPLDTHLWRHHGSGMLRVRERMRQEPAEAAPLVEGMHYILAQVTWAVRAEHAERLLDVMIRRTQLFYRAPDQGLACAPAVAAHMAKLLGRDDAWAATEVEAYRAEVAASRRGAEDLMAREAGAVSEARAG